MEIHEEFRIKINDPVTSWCYFPPLDVIVIEGNGSVTIIEAATGCVNKTYNLSNPIEKINICIDVVGKQKLAMARGNAFNCRSKFNDVFLGDSIFQTATQDTSEEICIDLPMPEAQMLLEALKTVPNKWENRANIGFRCTLDPDAEDSQDNAWKWSLVSIWCPVAALHEWLLEVTASSPDASGDSVPALPLISSLLHRLRTLQTSDLEARLSIYDRFKEVMNIEANRFLSFEAWPHSSYKWATPELMAKVGFYHHPRRANDDRALCFLCNICLITWEATDEPWSEHQRHSPNCPLFKHNFTSNVPLSVTEATTTAQKLNSPSNITLIAKSTSSRYVATVSEDGHICIWDTCYLFRKIAEFDAPILSKDGCISVDSACLIDNQLLRKPVSNGTDADIGNEDRLSAGFHLVLGARFIPDPSLMQALPDYQEGEEGEREGAFLLVVDVGLPQVPGLISDQERVALPDYHQLQQEDYRGVGGSGEDVPFEEATLSEMHFLQEHQAALNYHQDSCADYEDNDDHPPPTPATPLMRQTSFLEHLGLLSLWTEARSLPTAVSGREGSTRTRDTGSASLVHIVPLLGPDSTGCGLSASSCLPIVTEVEEEPYEEAAGVTGASSAVYIIVNARRVRGDGGGSLVVYRLQIDLNKDSGTKASLKLQETSRTNLVDGENIVDMFPISFESLESNWSESSSTANVDETVPEPVATPRGGKGSVSWLLLSSEGDLLLHSMPLATATLTEGGLARVPLKRPLPGRPCRLLLLPDTDRLCLLTACGVAAFYSLAPRRRDGTAAEVEQEEPVETRARPAGPEPLLAEQAVCADRLGLMHGLLRCEPVCGRLKLSYGCNWVEVSPLEIADFRTGGGSVGVQRRVPGKGGLLAEPPPFLAVPGGAPDLHCCTRTLNFRAGHACARDQVLEFSTAKQLCLGHVDLRVELCESVNKNSHLIYVTLLRQQKFNGSSNSSKEQTAGSIKVKTSQESNIIINDLEAPFIDDDLAQYYDEINVENLRKVDGEIVAGPYLLNKYCHSESTSVFLSMTSAELLKCRSRHYAIHIRIRSRSNVEERKLSISSPSASRYSTTNSSILNIKSISITVRKFSKPFVSVRNERSQRLAILRNHRFLRQLLDLLVKETPCRIPRPLAIQYCLDILNWIVVMYLNDIKPHSEKIHRIISISSEYLHRLILQHLVQGDRYTAKLTSKIINGLIKLESRYCSSDSRSSANQESSSFILSRSVLSTLLTNIDWLLLATNSVAVHNYLLIIQSLEQMFAGLQQSSNVEVISSPSSLSHKLKLLSVISQRYAQAMNTDEHIYLKTILGYAHDPLTGDLFDIVTDSHLSEPLNTLHSNLSDMYTNKKPQITIDGSTNDSISKYLMHTFHDHSLQHIQDQLNEQLTSAEDKVSGDFTIQDLQKVYHKMVMTNVSNNIQLMSSDVSPYQAPPATKIPDPPEHVQTTISNMTWPGFDPFLLSKMNPKQIIYSDMKKKLKSGHSSAAYNDLNQPVKTSSVPAFEQSHYRIWSARKNGLLDTDILPIFFESGSDGTFLETSEYSDQTSSKDPQGYADYSPNLTIPLMHLMDDHPGLPATPKTTPAITTQTTPMQNSPLQSPSSSLPNEKPEILETSSILLENINQQRLKFSQHTTTLLATPSSYFIVVNRLHANARRHIILDLRQLSLITDIIIPSSDKLQKIIVRIGRSKNEEEMQTVVVHSKIASDPLLLLNIQPKIVCQYVQIIVIAKSNITATRNRINMGTLYGRPAILPWEAGLEVSILPNKNWRESLARTLDQLRPQAETISVRYAMTCESLKHLLSKCLKAGIDLGVLSQATLDHQNHLPKTKLAQSRSNSSLVQLINQANSAYNKCCLLQQQLSLTNNQIRQFQAWLSSTSEEPPGSVIDASGPDKLRVVIELLLESLLVDKSPPREGGSSADTMDLISEIMTNVMWFGNREMQTIMVSWVPRFLTRSADVSQVIGSWCHDWLLGFLASTFTNKRTSLPCLNKEEIFSFVCVVFQRISNAGYHYHLLRNMLDVLIIIIGDCGRASVDIELLNWMMLLVDFVISWMDDNADEPFYDWKFLFWNNAYHNVDEHDKQNTSDGTKDRMNFLKQALLQLNSQKESFVEFIKKSQFDPWFSQLIMNEYLGRCAKVTAKINCIVAKMKKSLSVGKTKKPVPVTKKYKTSLDADPLLVAASSSIAVSIKLLLNTLRCMDFRVSQDTFILTCMVLNKLFVLAHESGLHLNDYIEKESISSIIQRAFRVTTNCTIGLDVYSLHSCKLLLSEIVSTDIRTLSYNIGEELVEEDVGVQEMQETSSVIESNQDDNGPDTDSVYNDEEDDPENEEEDITPTGADDEEMNSHPEEPYTFYITHLGNIAKQKVGTIKNNEESPSDEYVDIVEEFDFLSPSSSFIPTYHKTKFPKDYQSAFKPIELDKQISVNSLDSMRPDKNELDSSHSVLYYDIRLENTIFSHQEIMYNHSFINWTHQIRTQLYSQAPFGSVADNTMVNKSVKTPKPVAIRFVLESINELIEEDSGNNVNLEELVIFVSGICHHLRRENLLATFDALELCSVSLETLLDKILLKCSDVLTSLSLYCQLICFLLSFKNYALEQYHFNRIFQLSDLLQNKELSDDLIHNFKTIVTRSLENFGHNSEFFLDLLYNVVENSHRSSGELRASEQLAYVIIEWSRPNLIATIQRSAQSFSSFVRKILSLTKLYLENPQHTEERKCFTSLVPMTFTDQLMQIEKSLIGYVSVPCQGRPSVLSQLNLVVLDLIANKPLEFMSFVDESLLRTLFETLAICTSNLLENSKLSDVSTVSEDLVGHSQNISIADMVWRQLLKVAQAAMSSSGHLATHLLSCLLAVLQQSLPSINEPLFLVSIWLLKNLDHSEEVDYGDLLTSMISVITSSSDSRLSNAPLNTVTTRMAIAKMHRFNSLHNDQPIPSLDSTISNRSRLNVAPYCKIYCHGNDSSDPSLLSRLLTNQSIKSPTSTIRSTKLKATDAYWSYDFFPHETSVEIIVTLPCDMIVHKVILHPKSIREFSSKVEVTTLRSGRDMSTTTYQQHHHPISLNDGVVIDNIDSNRLSNKMILRLEKPPSSKLVMSRMEIFTINQWWDHRFQLRNDASNLSVFRCLHLFNYLIGIPSPSVATFVRETLPQHTKFFSILLNWNHLNSSSSELQEIRILNKSICNLIVQMFVHLGQSLEMFSSLFLTEILGKVSLPQSRFSRGADIRVAFTNEISIMELNIFYYILKLDDDHSMARLALVLDWFLGNVLTEYAGERRPLSYHDSLASIVYLLSVVLWHHCDRGLSLDLGPQFIGHIHKSLLLASGSLRKALYRLLCSVCVVQPSLFQELINYHPVINAADDSLNHGNLKALLWASRSKVGCKLLMESGVLLLLVKRALKLLTWTESDDIDTHTFCESVCLILSFLGKLCFGGCQSVKVWLGTEDVCSFWPLLLDYLINEGPCIQNMSSMLKMKLINASVFFFRAVTECCEANQLTFVKLFIDSMEKYRIRSDTIIFSNCLRRIILDVIVKEPRYCILVEMTESNTIFKRFPGWLLSGDEVGRGRLSFRHPALGCETNCILIETFSMTDTVSSIVSEISSEVLKQRSSSIGGDSLLSDERSGRPLFSADISLSYRQTTVHKDLDIFDMVALQESEKDFDGGFLRLSCSVHIPDKVEEHPAIPLPKAVNPEYLLVRFTEHGGLALLSMMMPLLYTDIRRISFISSTSYRPTTTTSVSSSMGFVDDEVVVPAEVSKVVKSLPLIPAHAITSLCLFLHIDLYPLYLIREHQYRSALIHLLLGITDDDCGVSLIQSNPQLQCLPFVILSELLQDSSLSAETRVSIVHQCIELGLVDFFINLLSILGHIDSGLSLNLFKSNGPWAGFISQSLCDLHFQLFSPMPVVDKVDSKTPTCPTSKQQHLFSSSAESKSQYITFMPFTDEKKNYWAKGTGFGTGGMYSTWDSEYVQLRQRLEETNASAILDTLSTFISPSDDEVVDLKDILARNEHTLPMKAVESIYQSSLLTFICCYLRNDSVLDVSQHVNIYKAVLRLIRALARHRCLHYLLFPHLNPVDTNPDLVSSLSQASMPSANISQLLFQLKICVDTYINRLKKAPGANTKVPENTRRLTRQFSIRRKNTNYSSFLQRINDALKTSKDSSANSKEDQKVAESENLTLLLPEIYGTLKLLEDVEADVIERNKKHEAENERQCNIRGDDNVSDCGTGESGVLVSSRDKPIRDLESRYMELMKKLQFGMFEMISPMSDESGKVKFAIPYHFKKNVENAVTSQSSAASLSRARRLAQETVTLSTSLPLSYSSSVFVRCDENHLDIMKVIIIGPPDTPYANGCFEFDVYFPPDYPKTPPLLNLQTTGNGSVRFNPNLYNEGKVCLSILNTWHGRPEERWSSRTSSFLQVLVSIQSLILVAEPYFNEPGYERSRGTPSGSNASRAYSANIQAATARWAIFEMMKNPPVCFAEVVRKHFLLKKDEVVAQIQAWIDLYLDPAFDHTLYNNTRPSIANSVQNLKKNLAMIKKEFENLEREDQSS